MDESSENPAPGRTQQFLAERLRRRYANCRESLAGRGDQPPQAPPAPPHAVAQAAAERPPAAAAQRFSTLFSEAYSAARDSQDHALNTILDRRRRHAAA
ncbi:hypothetical protein ASD55_13795 [Rhodanobacter sp. Root561]|uniref:hypothetical protein n=1 Tax=Rhodanobacter sp. Root561 TaxID=1736560 RepID=UPI0006F9F6C3|nr:hypothetical protein [Rhodanobacter sp. Root561]KQZ69104.1 hypothetical protein ASD55_13795 [Rhodanobacter sp. Root561]